MKETLCSRTKVGTSHAGVRLLGEAAVWRSLPLPHAPSTHAFVSKLRGYKLDPVVGHSFGHLLVLDLE